MRIPRFPLLGVALLITAAPAFADTVLLKNGRMITGKILREQGESLVVEVMDGQGRLTIHKATIAKVYKGDDQPPPVRQGIFPAKGPETPLAAAADAPAAAKSPLASAATSDLEARLAKLGPTKDELLAQLQPTPDEAAELAKLERALASGSGKDAAKLAAKGRLALMVAARALSSPDRAARVGAELAIQKLAQDERTLPYILALGIPEKLIESAADEKDAASAVVRQQARKALEAIAKTEPCDCQAAPTQTLTDDEKAKLEQWKAWWGKESAELAAWEQKKDEERAQIRAELARRGLKAYAREAKGRIDVRLAATEEPSLPEPRLILPRLVVEAPSDITVATRDKKRVLQFATVIENKGEGALEVRRSGVGTDDARAVQRVFARYPGNDRIVLEHETTVGTFIWHPQHKHFHLTPFARYELLDETFQPALGSGTAEKVSFCLRDSRPISGGDQPGHYRECGRDLQGISPGYADVYKHELADQDLPIDTTPDGIYYVVNALTAGFETGSAPEDRVAATKIQLTGDTVKVLARLDGRALVALQAQRRAALDGDK